MVTETLGCDPSLVIFLSMRPGQIHFHKMIHRSFLLNQSSLLGRLYSTNAAQSETMITWSEFFKTRRKLQIFQRIAGIPFAFAFFTAESVVLSLPIFDPTKMIFGMDPLLVVGASTIGGSIASYFLGVALSGVVWRKLKPELSQKLNDVIIFLFEIQFTELFSL